MAKYTTVNIISIDEGVQKKCSQASQVRQFCQILFRVNIDELKPHTETPVIRSNLTCFEPQSFFFELDLNEVWNDSYFSYQAISYEYFWWKFWYLVEFQLTVFQFIFFSVDTRSARHLLATYDGNVLNWYLSKHNLHRNKRTSCCRHFFSCCWCYIQPNICHFRVQQLLEL